jgi:hypothetical protein
MTTIAIKNRDAKMEKATLDELAKGYDLSLKANLTLQANVTHMVFKAHFENLFSKCQRRKTLASWRERSAPECYLAHLAWGKLSKQ